MLELYLLIGYSLLVGAVGLVVVLRSRLSESEREAQRLSRGWAEAREKITQLNTSLNGVTMELTKKNQRIAELQSALDRERERAQQKDASPWARDLPTSQRFEVALTQYQALTLRAELVVPYQDLRDLAKADLIRQLRAEVLQQAGEYVEVTKDCYDPCLMGERFLATLRVYRRPGG